MLNQPLITVLIPTYNCEDYIHDALKSILDQTYTNFECIIIDDCSKDNTVEIIKAFNDDRINLIVKPKNSGYTNSLNYGLTIAKGKYIARMDGDDISLPNRFEKQIEVMEADSSIVVCGSIFKILDTETIIQAPQHHNEIKTELLKDSCIGHPTAMIRKSVLADNNINYDHDGQVSAVRREKQRHSASKSRFDMLCSLKFDYSEEEKQAYIKQFSFEERLTFSELETIIHFKNKVYSSNKESQFFDDKVLREFFANQEEENINQYFKSNKLYNSKMINQYKKISKLTDVNFSVSDVFKLYIKSIIGYKKS